MTRLFIDIEAVRERAVARRLRRQDSRNQPDAHVLIAGPGMGSIGDEAMYEAFVRNRPGQLTVVARRPNDLMWKDADSCVTYVYLEHLLYGRPWRRVFDLRRLARLMRDARSLSIVGADIMDGVYSELSSVRRFRTAALAADAGLDARILGFSWNAQPAPQALTAMRTASSRVRLLGRDEASARRLVADGGQSVETVADLAFLTATDIPLKNDALRDWLDKQRAAGRRIIGINANPRLENRFENMRAQYLGLIEDLRSSGFSCVLLPHDSRGGERSEEAYMTGIAQAVGPEHVFDVAEAPLPDQVVAIARECELVVAGRMHLVVLTSVAGRSTVALEYQDKFAGLYQLLGYDGRVAKDSEGRWSLSEATHRGLSTITENERKLSTAWPTILERARRNIPTVGVS